MAFMDDIAALLVANGFQIGVDLFLTRKAAIPPLPAPGPFTTLIDTGGVEPTRTQNVKRATVRPSLQVSTSGSNPVIVRATNQAIHDILDGVYNSTLSGTPYLFIQAKQPPTETGPDIVGRAQFAHNIQAEKAP